MSTRAPSSSLSHPADGFKEQATRLQAYLREVGVPLKRNQALEAVARMQGVRNWQTLQATAEAPEPLPRPWLVLSYGAGALPSITMATTLDDAVQAFLHNVYLFACVRPTAEFRVLGEELDGGLAGLYLFMRDVLCVSMSQPAVIELKHQSPRYAFPEPTQFSEIATRIQAAIQYRVAGDVAARQHAVDRSLIAVNLRRNMDGELLRGAPPVGPAPPAKTNVSLWDIMGKIRMWCHATAVVMPMPSSTSSTPQTR